MLKRGEVSSLTGRLVIAQDDYYKDKLISYLFTPPPPAPEAGGAALLATVPQLLLMLGRETIQHIGGSWPGSERSSYAEIIPYLTSMPTPGPPGPGCALPQEAVAHLPLVPDK